MAAEGDRRYRTYMGEDGEIIPREATHIFVGECTFVRAEAFLLHPNIVEIIFHDKVEKIEAGAFQNCKKLRRVIMPGVKILEARAFYLCRALADVECGKLEIIGDAAFGHCYSLRSINLPSARIVEEESFVFCEALSDVKFDSKLERFGRSPFMNCYSLERITIPLKDNLFDESGSTFMGCWRLKHVALVEGELQETIAALQLEEWRNDMSEEINSINNDLLNSPAGRWHSEWNYDEGGKAGAINTWIRSVMRKIIHYIAEHQRVLNEATVLLELAIWKANLDDTDGGRNVRERVRTTRGSVKRARRELCVTSGSSIVIKNVLPFLELKS